MFRHQNKARICENSESFQGDLEAMSTHEFIFNQVCFFVTLIDGNLSRPLVFKADSILSQLLFVWSWPGTLKRKGSDVFLCAAVSNSLCGV